MSEPEYSVHPARPEDVGAILGFIRELAEFEKLSHEMQADERDIGQWLFGEHRAAEVVMARSGGQPVGFALFFTSFSTFLGQPGMYLEDLYVQPAHRGKGIGQALLRHLAGIACARGYGRLEWSVLNWNDPAIRFYERMGAEALPEWTTWRVSADKLRAMARPQSGSAK